MQTISPHFHSPLLGGNLLGTIKLTTPHSFPFATSRKTTSKHNQHAFHIRPWPRCRRRSFHSSDHRAEQLPIPDRPRERPRCYQTYVQTHIFTSTFTNGIPEYWCDQNVAQCPLICLQQPGVSSQTTEANDCDSVSSPSFCIHRTESGGAGEPWCSAQPDYHWLALSSAPQQPQPLLRNKANKAAGYPDLQLRVR